MGEEALGDDGWGTVRTKYKSEFFQVFSIQTLQKNSGDPGFLKIDSIFG